MSSEESGFAFSLRPGLIGKQGPRLQTGTTSTGCLAGPGPLERAQNHPGYAKMPVG